MFALSGDYCATVLAGLIVDFGGVLTDPGDGDGTEPPLVRAVVRARRHGLRTALLSNADGVGGPTADGVFDAVVLSGEVGFGKPDPRIYLLTAERLGLVPEECVFVDDLVANVRGAVRTGMVGVHHTDVDTTLTELNALFGFPFR
jgi:FMN phosphatase YigB (HAD superfamily)